MAELGPPFGGITRIRFKGFVYDVSAIRLPRSYIYTETRIGPARLKSIVQRSEVRGQRSDVRNGRTAQHPLHSHALYPANVTIQSPGSNDRVDYYCAAASCFTLVWKMAIHVPFSFFQTDPELNVPEWSLPSNVPSIVTV